MVVCKKCCGNVIDGRCQTCMPLKLYPCGMAGTYCKTPPYKCCVACHKAMECVKRWTLAYCEYGTVSGDCTEIPGESSRWCESAAMELTHVQSESHIYGEIFRIIREKMQW